LAELLHQQEATQLYLEAHKESLLAQLAAGLAATAEQHQEVLVASVPLRATLREPETLQELAAAGAAHLGDQHPVREEEVFLRPQVHQGLKLEELVAQMFRLDLLAETAAHYLALETEGQGKRQRQRQDLLTRC
jgi:hypothetical protein